MINVNEFKNGVTIKFDNNIYQVLEFQHVKPGKGPAFVRTKLKNLRSKAIIDHTFNAGIKVETAHISKQKMAYLYEQNDKLTFMDMATYEQVELPVESLKAEKGYLKENLEVDLIFYESEMLGIILPEKIEMEIKETEPGVKGNTATNATKEATLETGLTIRVPLFIEQGERVIINTKEGKYVSRA